MGNRAILSAFRHQSNLVTGVHFCYKKPMRWKLAESPFRGLVLVSATLSLLAACSSPLSLESHGGKTLPYDKELDRWTRTQRVYGSVETSAVVHATFLSPPFADAYMKESNRVFEPTPAQAAKARTEMEQRLEAHACFFLALHTEEQEWNDLELRNSRWRLYLQTDAGDRVIPDSVRQVSPRDRIPTGLFPYATDFYEFYEVCFPSTLIDESSSERPVRTIVNPTTRWLQLQMRSPMARMDLTWKLVPQR